MKIETLSFFRTHILMNDKRELFPIVNLVLDKSYPELTQVNGLHLNIETERIDYENIPLVLLHMTLHYPQQFTIKKTKTIDYLDRSTVEFFDEVFSEDPFLFGFSTPEFYAGKTKEFQYIPAYLTADEARRGKWDIELAFTDSKSREITGEKLNPIMAQWWEKIGKELNAKQDSVL